LQSQVEDRNSFTKRVLFVLDGSGSMNERWHGESKWEMAVQTLSNLIDSFEQSNRDFEIGIRVLGHQYPRAMLRCDDTKMEIDFSSDLNYEKVNTVLKKLRPQGQTPLAYSIEQSEKDFKNDIKAQNIIVLITDGLENCNGNPCEVAQRLREKNIFINPYIIGLGIDSLESQKLECIGKFIDAKNKAVFREVVKTILTEVSKKTTLTINFVKSDSSSYPFYVPFSLIDKKTGRDIHSFVFTSTTKKYLDTININPQYQYQLLVHTNPPFYFDSFSIIKGAHQHYIVPIASGIIDYASPDKNKKNLFFLSNSQFLNIFWHPSLQPFIIREQDPLRVEMIQLPIVSKPNIAIKEDDRYSLPFLPKGILIVKKNESMMASIFSNNWEKLLEIDGDILNTYELLIGDYFILYKEKNSPSESSKIHSIKIGENLTTQLLLQ